MRCPVCNNNGRPMYCSHCINSSPNLLARLRIDLLTLAEANSNLKERVGTILKIGLNRVDQYSHSKEKINFANQTKNIEGEILGERLLKLEILRLRKNNNRIRYRITQENSKITQKRQRKEMIERELQHHESLKIKLEKESNIIGSKKDEEELKYEALQIKRVVRTIQEAKLKNLIKWFIVKKHDSYDFPYTLAFQPVVSLKNFYKLPSMVAWSSIFKMSQYVTLTANILMFQLPYSLNQPPTTLIYSLDDHDESSNNISIASYLAKLVIDILQLSRYQELISPDPVDLAWLLDQYDLDTLFYNLITSQKMKSRPISYHWTYEKVLAVVSETLQLSIYATSPASRPTLDGVFASNTDKWYLVG